MLVGVCHSAGFSHDFFIYMGYVVAGGPQTVTAKALEAWRSMKRSLDSGQCSMIRERDVGKSS